MIPVKCKNTNIESGICTSIIEHDSPSISLPGMNLLLWLRCQSVTVPSFLVCDTSLVGTLFFTFINICAVTGCSSRNEFVTVKLNRIFPACLLVCTSICTHCYIMQRHEIDCVKYSILSDEREVYLILLFDFLYSVIVC